MSTSISRADFLKALGGLGILGLGLGGKNWFEARADKLKFPCRMLGPSKELGHLLRQPRTISDSSAEVAAERSKVTIVGGGIAGLSAAWWLKKNGFQDFVLLELEKEVGGNSVCAGNQWGNYPWGAHYVPIANKESTYVRQLFEELKIIQGYDRAGEPIYDELMLCHEPQDRLYKDGAFHEGLVPKRGLQKNESADIARFFSLVLKFRQATGDDGKPAFAIPLDSSSADKTYRDLDKLSMAQWLKENNFCSEPLLWYINYCCRDDYGATIEKVSAWAGIHYFAGRRGTAANAEPNAVLTWPQGNGYLVERLRSLVGAHIHTNSMVTAISEAAETVRLNVMEARSKSTTSRQSELVIFAAPRFIASKLIAEQAGMAADLQYAPWLVANIAIKGLPESRGAAPAWDNVSYYSDSLGYVMANHQEITTRAKASVITYYYPLSDKPPKLARKFLYTASADNLAAMIVRDLEKMHPGIKQQIISMDLWPWGHGMISPGVDFIWSGRRQKLKESKGNILFAHSDMSGISNFEEAQYHGVEAAKQVLARLKDS